MVFIEAKNIYLEYPVFGGSDWVRSAETSKATAVGGIVTRKNKRQAFVQALSDISFRLEEGQSVGLIGRNGAGKSSLLKVLAGIYHPTRGEVLSQGNIRSLLALNAGVETHLSGLTNIRRLCLLTGADPKDVPKLTEEVVDFCELGDFIHLPMNTYSSGMLVRLTFAIHTAVAPEVLLIDEGLGVGDMAFMQKTRDRLKRVLGDTKVVVFASHSTRMLKELCDQGLWLEKGKIKAFGDIDDVLEQYESAQQSLDAKG